MPQPPVSVITPATGHRDLARCLASVQAQTYENLEHLVVVDGPERRDAVEAAVERLGQQHRRLKLVTLPHVTGKDGWKGHRIYAAFSFLSATDFVVFLDEDNWFDADHVQCLAEAVLRDQTVWGFALRKICGQDGRFITYDACESLGHLHPVYTNDRDRLVDTNCYFIRRDAAIRFAPMWTTRQARVPGSRSPDRSLCRALLENYPPPACSMRFSVNYAVGSGAESVTAEFFLEGNRRMRARYPDGVPWMPASCPTA